MCFDGSQNLISIENAKKKELLIVHFKKSPDKFLSNEILFGTFLNQESQSYVFSRYSESHQP
jgi:tRNA A22 N-methylase